MSYEISSLTSYPYRAVTHLEVTFSDGYKIVGSGAVVGRNDVLTATHMVYNPDHGGWAKSARIFAGADYNSVTGQITYAPYGSCDAAYVNAWPTQAFAVPSNTTMDSREVPYDIAVLSTREAIGDKVGWFGLSTGYNTSQFAYEIGYPAGSTGMMLGQAWIIHDRYYEEYHAYASDGSDIMGPGSSGGPLFVESNGKPYIIGVKSAGSSTTSQWADIGLLYEKIREVVSSNDYLIAASSPPTQNAPKTGTSGWDVFTATTANDIIDGGAGVDSVIYSSSFASYSIAKTSNVATVVDKVGAGGTDTLSNIERLQFSDKSLAFDISGNAGQVYRLYQAAFNRAPDKAGLGDWIYGMDHDGVSLLGVSAGFINSAEFASVYGANPTNAEIVTRFYQNVLHRAPEQAGFDYWMNQIESGVQTRIQVLTGFSESPENQAQIIGVIQNGIEYTQHQV